MLLFALFNLTLRFERREMGKQGKVFKNKENLETYEDEESIKHKHKRFDAKNNLAYSHGSLYPTLCKVPL
jgi:hypothetical protein